MFHVASRTWLFGVWLSMLAVVVTVSVAMAATTSTTMLLLALGVAPGVVIALLTHGPTSPTVAEILHPVESSDGRA